MKAANTTVESKPGVAHLHCLLWFVWPNPGGSQDMASFLRRPMSLYWHSTYGQALAFWTLGAYICVSNCMCGGAGDWWFWMRKINHLHLLHFTWVASVQQEKILGRNWTKPNNVAFFFPFINLCVITVHRHRTVYELDDLFLEKRVDINAPFLDSANAVCAAIPVGEMKINRGSSAEIRHMFNY